MDADVIVVGAGLAGLVAAAEAADAGRRVILVEQEPEQALGGQAWWSLGGVFLVGTPEQRRVAGQAWWAPGGLFLVGAPERRRPRVRASAELAWSDWLGPAGFDRPEDEWP